MALDTRTQSPVDKLLASIHWYGHDAFRIDGSTAVVYIDPWQLPDGLPKADIILITHEHHDHCSPDDITKIVKETTRIVGSASAVSQCGRPATTVQPGDTLTVGSVKVTAIAAYNVNKFRSPGKPFHPREALHVGYNVQIDGVRVYHAGDSDFTPEMKQVTTDIALLPVSGTYVMTAEEAAKAADAIKPKVAIPMHVGRTIGKLDDARTFGKLTRVRTEIRAIETE